MKYLFVRLMDRIAVSLRALGLHRFTSAVKNMLGDFLIKEITVEFGGHLVISVPLKDRAFLYSIKECKFEKETTDTFNKVIRPGMTVVDIGAFVGYYSILAADLVGPRGKVYAFEPDPVSYSFLRKNVDLNGFTNVETIQKAVSNKNATAELMINVRDSSMTSLVKRKESKRTVLVECVTLDSFIGEQKVDVIKIDIEGAEPWALEGMRNVVRKNPDIVMFVELNPTALNEAGSSTDVLLDLLKNMDFDNIVSLDKQRGQNGELLLSNLYCRKKHND